MVTFYLVRHGESEGNTQKRFQGQQDLPLSESGFKQADALGKRFDGIAYDAVFTSPLIRAVKTAERLNAAKNRPIIVEPDFIEIDVGGFSGHNFEETEKVFPKQLHNFREEPWKFEAPNGEAMTEVYSRSVGAFNRVAEQYDGKTIIIVSHVCVIRCLLCLSTGLPLEKIGELPYCGNTAVSKIIVNNGVSAEFINDSSHLKGVE